MSPSRMMMIEMLKWSGDEVTMTRDSDTDSDKSLLSWWSDMCGTFSKECSSGKYDQIYWQNNLISNSLFVLEILISTSLNIKCYQISSEPRINTSVSTTLTSLYCQEFHHTSEPELSWYFDLIIVIGSKMMLITWTIFILSWKILDFHFESQMKSLSLMLLLRLEPNSWFTRHLWGHCAIVLFGSLTCWICMEIYGLMECFRWVLWITLEMILCRNHKGFFFVSFGKWY